MSRAILVTGASGYIGRHLVRHLKNKGERVIGFSRYEKPQGMEDVEWRCGDVTLIDSLEKVTVGCDVVVHLACSSLKYSLSDPLYDFRVNASGTLNMLEVSRRCGVKKFIYTSTAQVYGSKAKLPMKESEPVFPDTPYAASKLSGEIYCKTYSSCFGLNTVILRLFNVYGSDISSITRDTVESIFINRVKRGLSLVVKDITESRDFIHISDVVYAICLAMDSDVDGETINIGTGEETTIYRLAEMIKNIANSDVDIVVEGKLDNPIRMQADIEKAKKLLKFCPKVSLYEGLLGMINQS